MLPAPPPGPNIGAFELQAPLPQDLVGSVVRELRTSMLDVGTALRLGGRGRLRYFGTVLPPMQRFASPADVNSEDAVRAGVKASGNAPRALNKTASSGTGSKARTLPIRKL